MQGKYKIYISYIMVMLIGVVLFILFILFIEKRNKINLEEIVTTAPIQTSPSLNKNLEEPIKMIDNIEALNTKEEDIKNIYRVVTNILNIREKPNTESKIIRQMHINQKIFIENIEGKWGKVAGGGFVYMELLSKE